MDPSPEEAARLSALTRCRILDTGTDESFDELAQLAANLTACPMAMVGIVDRDRLWVKSAVGLARRELPRVVTVRRRAGGRPARSP